MAAAGALVAASAGAASAQTVLTCGQTLTASVTLTQNLDCSADTTTSALIIGAPGITVNLHGHKILGPGGETYAIDDSAGYNGLTVEYGTLADFYAAVVAEGTSTTPVTGLVVQKLTITSSSPETNYGVGGEYVTGARIHNLTINDLYGGVELQYSTDSTVGYNHLNSPYYGISDDGSTGDTFVHNTLTGVADYGIEAQNTQSLVVKGNTVSGQGANGISEYETLGSVVTGNHLNHLYGGIYDDYVTGSMVSHNTGFGDAWGLYSYDPTSVSYASNTFGSGEYGLETDYPASESITGNVTSHNSEAGVYVYDSNETSGHTATLTGNTADYNRFGLYSQVLTTGANNHAVGNKVLNCFNVACGSAPASPGTGSVPGARTEAGPPHRTPRTLPPMIMPVLHR